MDGTITDQQRRLHCGAIESMRDLVARGVEVVPASGNTACFMDALCRSLGTSGAFMGENGGVYRIGYSGKVHISGDQSICWDALAALQSYYMPRGIKLDLFSPQYRYSDLAFARTVPVKDVEELLKDYPVRVVDTGFAVHLQSPEVDKGTGFIKLAKDMGLETTDFLVIGDGMNDIPMLELAGVSVAVGNARPETRAKVDYITKSRYGDGFVEAIHHYSSYFLERLRSTTI